MNGKFLRKVFAAGLSVMMLCSAGFTGTGQLIGTDISVNAAVSGDFEYSVLSNGDVKITGYKGSNKVVSIPAKIDGRKVTEIGSEAFYANEVMETVTIPSGVAFISDKAFRNCENLTTVNMPDTVVSISDSAFLSCRALKNITLPENLEFMGESVFENCLSLEEIRIPKKISRISFKAFYCCLSLKSVMISKGVESIDHWAFMECESLEYVLFPDTMMVISPSAFKGCTAMKGLYIPSSVEYIYWHVFDDCDNLTIYGDKDSYARQYAEENNIPFAEPSALVNSSAVSKTKIVLGKTVTVNARASGGTDSYVYSVLYKKKTDKNWTKKQDFKPNAKVSIKPAKATDYQICVKVMDGTGSISKKYYDISVVEPVANVSQISATSIKLGSKLTVTAKAEKGIGNYTYAVFYKKKSDKNWTKKQDFGTNAQVSIKPAKATDYEVCVKIKDSTGTTAKKYFNVKVS